MGLWFGKEINFGPAVIKPLVVFKGTPGLAPSSSLERSNMHSFASHWQSQEVDRVRQADNRCISMGVSKVRQHGDGRLAGVLRLFYLVAGRIRIL